jgi:methylmalonyl-CoA/ethylmalonyl-CoA epimerase
VVFLGDKQQRIELVQPTDGQSGVAKFVAEHPRPTLHHVCYVVDDLAGTLERLGKDGVELIDQAPRRGAEGLVAFIHPRASGGVLIELIDRASLRDSIP